jgi:hypothetical protein
MCIHTHTSTNTHVHAAEAFQAAGSFQGDAGVDSSSAAMGPRKRSFNGDNAAAAATEGGSRTPHTHQCNHSAGVIAEEEEEEEGGDTVGEGPTPQRRRRAGECCVCV